MAALLPARHRLLTRCAYENEIPKLARGDRRQNPGLRPRIYDTETGPGATHAPCSRAFYAKEKIYVKTMTYLAGAPGFEPGNGGIKIHLFCRCPGAGSIGGMIQQQLSF